MTLADRIAFLPLIPGWALAALGGALVLALGLYAWRGGRAVALKAAAAGLALLALAQPLLVREAREPARDVAAVVIDQSQSLAAAGRLEAARALGERVAKTLTDSGDIDVRVREVRGDADGTALVAGLEEALADAPRDRIAGAILITDGQVSDVPADLKRLRALGPVHALIVGDPGRGDRRLELLAAPAFGLVDQPITVEGIVHDPARSGLVSLRATIDGEIVRDLAVAANEPFKITLPAPKRGANLVLLEAAPGPQEITLDNNRAAFSLAGVRDRLRVLLVTGEPYPGARVWRNLLKGDPAVDLVHFTILRPPEKLDDTPIEELALIQFPTRELFVEKLDRFDLIIFDRYRQRGILPLAYFENVARRVEAGGALLIAAGPYDGGEDSLFRTPLAAILPSQPDGGVIERPFRPTPTDLGARHPVVRGLPDPTRWGRWERMVSAKATGGETVLQGPDGRPLLVLGRAGKGRVAQLWSDQVWLWARGFDGGGPHGELLRRLAHWLMQEPELDEERLKLTATAEGLTLERTTLNPGAPAAATLTQPDGAERTAAFAPAGPGLWRATIANPAAGVWRAQSDDLSAFAAIGPADVRETAALNATTEILEPLAQSTGGAAVVVGETGDAAPEVRRIGRLGAAHGAGWVGLRRREGYVVRSTAAEPLAPGWVWVGLALALLMVGWRQESGNPPQAA